MKNLAKILVMTLLVSLFGVVAISSLVASPGDIQSPQTAIKFDAPSGIRWNQGKEGGSAFEVFNAAGFSYIASGFYINAAGEYSSTDNVIGGVQATGDKIYHIMQDIPYAETAAMNPAFKGGTSQVDGYPGPRFKILSGGVVNGRGCTISNFPIRNGSALFESNAGSIQNLKVQNVTFSNTSTSGTQIGLITKTNTGTIDDCEVKTGTLNVSSASIGAIAYESNGSSSMMMNCLNNLEITTTGTLSAGIVASTVGGEILRNINNAAITGANAAGIAALSDDNTQIKSNTNHGNITGSATACGILASGKTTKYNNHENISANTNNESVVLSGAGEKAEIYIGMPEPQGNEGDDIDPFCGVGYNPDVTVKYQPPSTAPPYGIAYHTNDNVFLVTNQEGVSYIGSGKKFNAAGELNGTGAVAAANSAQYYITNDIVNSPMLSTAGIPVASNGLVDGQGYKLTNFSGRGLFSTIASGGTVRNINLHIGGTEITDFEAGGLAKINNGTIENCIVTGSVSTNSSFGGIAFNSLTGVFRNCTNRVSIVGKGTYTGGSINSIGYAGIVAFAGDSTVVVDCVNAREGQIIVSGGSVLLCAGGIVGRVWSGRNALPEVTSFHATIPSGTLGALVASCYNLASIKTSHSSVGSYGPNGRVGGIVGGFDQAQSYSYLSILYCGNEATTFGSKLFVLTSNVYCGGLLGGYYRSQTGSVTLLGYNSMNIEVDGGSAASRYLGGIVGGVGALSNGQAALAEFVRQGVTKNFGVITSARNTDYKNGEPFSYGGGNYKGPPKVSPSMTYVFPNHVADTNAILYPGVGRVQWSTAQPS